MALVSIIVPIYNVDAYLTKCIDSLINQTLRNIEIILVNDGSTDKCGKICDEYKIKDNRIKVIHKENGGLSDARNKGLDMASSEYVAFIDSDDWIDVHMIEKLYSLSIKYGADIVQGDYIEVYTDDDVIKTDINNIETNCYNREQALELLYSEKHEKTVITWNKLYKRTLFEGIKFPKGKVHEDEFTTYKLLDKANILVDTNIPIYYYRQRAGSIMNSEFNIKRLDALEAWIERKKYFEQNNLEVLKKKTESMICSSLRYFYFKVKISNIENKHEILNELKYEIKQGYMTFITNKYISLKEKIMITICIINEDLFSYIYNKYYYFNSY